MIELKAFYGFNDLTDEDKAIVCNGAGAAGDWRSKLIPNTLYGLNCTPAFDIHDYDYHVGITHDDKDLADRQLLTNLLILIDNGNWCLAFFRRRRAMKYYEAVKLAGDDAFWKSKNRGVRMGYQDGRQFDVVSL